ncbi:MAG: AAA family ATPase [Actinomycetota bacterium]|nr:AAA family ATPase [Actinomycetota bacterium]
MSIPGRRDARLLERERELEWLVGQLESARNGHGGVALVLAAAGLGKTTLLREARTLGRERGLSVFTARGAELERESPFGLTRQLLERVRGALRPEERDELGRGAAGVASSLLDGSGAPTGGDISGLLHGLYWFLSTASELRRLLLCLDDVHWSDAETIRLVAYLASRIESLPLFVLCAARPVEPGVAPGLLQSVAASEEVALATLEPLSVVATAELVVQKLGVSAATEWVQTSHRITGGNPFFLSELLWTVNQRSLSLTTEGAVALGRAITPRTSDAIAARLDRAGPAAEAVAAATAVLSGDAGSRISRG